jgi:hypothetical protein
MCVEMMIDDEKVRSDGRRLESEVPPCGSPPETDESPRIQSNWTTKHTEHRY